MCQCPCSTKPSYGWPGPALLDTTDQSIAAVAAATGYPDSFYFARQFKKVHEVTPFGYREQRKG